MLERTDAIMNEVLDPITFVLAYPTVLDITVLMSAGPNCFMFYCRHTALST